MKNTTKLRNAKHYITNYIWSDEKHSEGDIKLGKELLKKNSTFKQIFIHRGLNTHADSLASLGSYLIKNGWPDDMNVVYLNEHCLKVVIRIIRDQITRSQETRVTIMVINVKVKKTHNIHTL